MEMTDVCEQLYKARLARVLGIGVPPTTVASFSHFKASGGSVKSNSQKVSFSYALCVLLFCDDDSFSSCSIAVSVFVLSSLFHCSLLLSIFASVCFMRMNWWRMMWVRRL